MPGARLIDLRTPGLAAESFDLGGLAASGPWYVLLPPPPEATARLRGVAAELRRLAGAPVVLVAHSLAVRAAARIWPGGGLGHLVTLGGALSDTARPGPLDGLELPGVRDAFRLLQSLVGLLPAGTPTSAEPLAELLATWAVVSGDAPAGEGWGRAATAMLLDRHQDVDAVLCGSDQIARGVMDVLRERGHRVPEDVAVMGFDNWQVLTSTSRPPAPDERRPEPRTGRTRRRARPVHRDRRGGALGNRDPVLPGGDQGFLSRPVLSGQDPARQEQHLACTVGRAPDRSVRGRAGARPPVTGFGDSVLQARAPAARSRAAM